MSLSEESEIINAIVKNARKISHPLDLKSLAEKISNKKVVMLGEATHGSSEFYAYRAILSEILIREHGFNFVAVEGDWPDASRLRRYIRKGEGKNARSVLKQIHRWPLWMWANEEVVSFAETLRFYQCGFYGLDVYSLYDSIAEVVRFLKKTDPLLAKKVEERYACLEKFKGSEIAYSQSLLKGEKNCESEAVSNLEDILRLRMENEHDDGELIFDAQQNARVVRNAEKYYRTMLEGGVNSWNERDHHMQDTLEQLLEHHGSDSKAIVWAHNTHVGDYRATDMWGEGYVNLGGLARRHFGTENVALIGFGTYQGSVVASHAWGSREEIMKIPPARAGSLEEICHRAALELDSKNYFLFFDEQDRSAAFTSVLGHRAIGVVYHPEHESRGQYVPTILSERYDAFIYLDRTQAIQSLSGVFQRGNIPETWPQGV